MLSLEFVALLAATAIFVVLVWRTLGHGSGSSRTRTEDADTVPTTTTTTNISTEELPTVKIVYASQTGTALKIAQLLAEAAKAAHINVRFCSFLHKASLLP
jgi:sulfite reductase alpha subunit-like flavoprotein